MIAGIRILLLVVLAGAEAKAQTAPVQRQPAEVTVGSKAFTESEILGEMIVHLARDAGAKVTHKAQLGGTQFVFKALVRGDIDIYPEYTGTISHELFARQGLSERQIRQELIKKGVRMSRPLGFNNGYALAMKRPAAEKLGVRRISDLREHPRLALGFSNEFIERGDGWPSLRQRYQLPQKNVRGMEHNLTYRALDSGDIDVMEIYTTDAKVQTYDLRILDDDQAHFPYYDAVLLYRADLDERAPQVVESIKKLEGRILDEKMIKMNIRATIDKVSPDRVAANFLAANLRITVLVQRKAHVQILLRNTRDHLLLVAVSLSAAIVIAIPLGIVAARQPWLGQAILGSAGVMQTIPSLALLVLLIPILGIGAKPAIFALFLYSLLPIVRNTYAGLHDIPPQIRESAEALGLSSAARLRLVELPMASRAIFAGIKTSAIINVGTATLGGLIGAGGYGQPIMTGITRDDPALMFWHGALPSAVLALVVQGLFEICERFLVPKGLRLKPVE